jgi:hypothetical protein
MMISILKVLFYSIFFLPFFFFVTLFLIPFSFDDSVLLNVDNYIEVDKIIKQRFIKLSTGVTLNVNEGGNPNGKLILFVHG